MKRKFSLTSCRCSENWASSSSPERVAREHQKNREREREQSDNNKSAANKRGRNERITFAPRSAVDECSNPNSNWARAQTTESDGAFPITELRWCASSRRAVGKRMRERKEKREEEEEKKKAIGKGSIQANRFSVRCCLRIESVEALSALSVSTWMVLSTCPIQQVLEIFFLRTLTHYFDE